MRICGIASVRDSHELLETSIRHLSLNGIEDFYLYDHNSSPSLRRFLADTFLCAGIRVRVLRKESRPFFQHAMVNALAALARSDGFDVAVAFDADEFWCSTVEGRTLADQVAVEMSAGVDALRVQVVNYAQHHGVTAFEADSLRTAAYAITPYVDLTTHPREQVDAGMPFVAMPFPSKVIGRLSRDMRLTEGQHDSVRADGKSTIVEAAGIVVRHLSLPSRDNLAGKREHGLSRLGAGNASEVGWQLQRLAHMTDDELDVYWGDNSWRVADDQRVLVGSYDRVTEDDALVRIAHDLARARACPGMTDVDGVVGESPLRLVPGEQLEHLVECVVDDLGMAEQTAERSLQALRDEAGARLIELQQQLEDRTEWALALQRELAEMRSTLAWRAHCALEDSRRALATVVRRWR